VRSIVALPVIHVQYSTTSTYGYAHAGQSVIADTAEDINMTLTPSSTPSAGDSDYDVSGATAADHNGLSEIICLSQHGKPPAAHRSTRSGRKGKAAGAERAKRFRASQAGATGSDARARQQKLRL
jgi:hypothetical protein